MQIKKVNFFNFKVLEAFIYLFYLIMDFLLKSINNYFCLQKKW